jgi:peroxiredoxin (alkyl hydroperoxide reductase subunit C)
MSHGREPHCPGIFETAPDFEAKSTDGPIHLSDYAAKGRYVLLFSYSADFNPVCSTEIIALAKAWKRFEDMEVQLIGISIDSIYSHIAWLRDLEKSAEIEIKFPIIADPEQKIAGLYGLLHPESSNTSTVHAVFAIDPNHSIRAIQYYPQQLGRNIEDLIRLFQGLQAIDSKHISVPADWVPGNDVIVTAPTTLADAAKRANGGAEGAGLKVETWYLSKKEIDIKELEASKPKLIEVSSIVDTASPPKEFNNYEMETANFPINFSL